MNPSLDIATKYLASWNEAEAPARARRIAELWRPDGAFADPIAAGQGHEAIGGIIAGVRQHFPGCAFRLAREPEMVGSRVRLSWALASNGEAPVAKGTDVLEIAGDGRLQSVVGFFDLMPGTPDHPAWSIASWVGFWKQPSAQIARARVPTVVAPGVTARWPYQGKTVRGVEEYRDYIVELLTIVPDLALTLEDQASEGGNHFLRWSATGTGPDGPIHASGVDRIRTEGGKVVDNRIFSDHPVFRTLATRMAPRLSESSG